MRERGVFILVLAAVALGVLVFAWQRGPYPPPNGARSADQSGSGSTGTAQVESTMKSGAEKAQAIQRRYWSPNPQERRQLLSRGMAALSWNEKLRLLHLTCLDELSTDASRRMLENPDLEASDMPAGPNRDLVETLVTDLRSALSPYRPRSAAVWTGKAGESDRRQPDAQGMFENASFTHLGGLEVVRLDIQQQPIELVFVPLDDLRGVALASPAIFRLAKLFYEDGRADEIALLPMIYGVSWSTSNSANHDGSLTTFIASIQLNEKEQARSIGVGHQDFVVSGDGNRIMGLGAIGEIMVALSVDDARFEQKCRARGLDPSTVRSDLSRKR